MKGRRVLLPAAFLALVPFIACGRKDVAGPEPAGNRPVYAAVYVYTKDCGICEEIRGRVFPEAERAAGVRLDVVYLDAEEGDNFGRALHLEAMVGRKAEGFPVLFVGDAALYGEAEIKERMVPVLLDLKARGVRPDLARVRLEGYGFGGGGGAAARAVERLRFLPVAVSGLLDGVNPCAFSTLVFLLSFLFFVRLDRRAIFLTGLAYTAGVFTAYFGAGLGLFQALKALMVYRWVARGLWWGSVGLLAAVAVLSAVDTVRYLGTGKPDFILRMSEGLRRRVHEVVRRRAGRGALFGSSFGLGVLLALFELACTGQVYLPTILYILQVPDLRWKGVGYLLLYNLMFIVPLLVVFGVAWLGVSSKAVEGFFRRHLLLVKVLTTLLFVFLLVSVLVAHPW